MITCLKQPKRSKLCGQTCLAMAAGVPVEQAIAAVGHKHGTRPNEIIDAAQKLGLCVPVKRLRSVVSDTEFPALYIARVVYPRRRNGHWVLFYQGALYDPSPTPSGAGRICAYLELERK